MDPKLATMSSDGLHTVPNILPDAPSHDFEQTLHSIGYHLHSLGDAVGALADRNRNLLDTSLENCQAVLQDMLHRHAHQPGHLVSNAGSGSLEYSDTWTGAPREDFTDDRARSASVCDHTASSPQGKESRVVRTVASNGEEMVEAASAKTYRETSGSAQTQSKTDLEFCRDFENQQAKAGPATPAQSRLKFLRRMVASSLQNRKAEAAVGSLIVANAALLGYQSDVVIQDIDRENPMEWRVLDVFFTIAFTIELLLRVFADGPVFFSSLNRDRNWNAFDLIMVVSAIGDELVGAIVGSNAANMSAVRVLRILRLVRVIRVIRVMRVFQDLRLMVAGIISCLKPLTWALCLLMLIMFCFAVCILQFAASELKSLGQEVTYIPTALRERYGSLLRAMATLYMSITGGIDWEEATDPLEFSPILRIIFFGYIAFALFCCLNIVTGVFVENAHKMSARDEDHMIMEEMEKHQHWLEDVKRAFAAADKDGSGVIDLEEFKAFQQDPRMQAFLRKLGVDWSLEKAERLFKQLDFDKTGTIAFDEFIMAIQKLTGATRAMDMINLMHDAKVMKNQLAKLVNGEERATTMRGVTTTRSSSASLFTPHNRRSTQAGVFQLLRDDNDEHEQPSTLAHNTSSKEKSRAPERGVRTEGGAHNAASNPPRHDPILPEQAPTTSSQQERNNNNGVFLMPGSLLT